MSQVTIEQALQLALAHYQAGRFADAEGIYRQILARFPNHSDALISLGTLAGQQGRYEEAVALLERALAANPAMAKVQCNLGEFYRRLGRIDQAIAAFRRAIALEPGDAVAHYNLGRTLQDQSDLDGAIAAYRQAIQIKSDFSEAFTNLANVLKDQGRLDETLAALDHAIALRPADAVLQSKRLLVHMCQPAYDAAALLREHQEWNRLHALPLAHRIRSHDNDRTFDRRLRVGYVSADFRAHPMAHFFLPLIAHHNPQNVEIFCYSSVTHPDKFTQRIEPLCHHWRDITALSDSQLADQVRADKIDILVDLAMHGTGNRLLAFARKPAPVQVTWLGYPGTTGLSTIDYRLSDPTLDPPGPGDACYTETTVRLPRTFWCYDPIIDTPAPNALPASRNGFVTFACFNNFAKVSRPAIETWIELLAALPDSRLLLHCLSGSHQEVLRQQFGQAGVAASRVEFAPRVSLDQYFLQHHKVDILLDPFPFGGGTTTCHALWMGVPLVTLRGATAVGRGGASLLTNLDLLDWIAETPDHYVAIALAIARDLPRLAALRATLRQRMQASPLMDARRFALDMEAAYREMWRKWCT